MNKAGPSDVLGGVAIAALLVCCGGPLLLAALLALVAGAGLIVQGAVLVGVLGLGLAAALAVRYVVRRSAIAQEEQGCASCARDPGARHRHAQHAAPPPA